MKETKIFTATKGAPFSHNKCQTYGEYLDNIEQKEGFITPAIIVKKSKAKKSVLHDYFEWDNSAAGTQWRLQQARNLMNHIEVTIISNDKPSETIKFLHNIRIVPESKDREYISVSSVVQSADYHSQVIDKALVEVKAWKKRYKQYSELTKIFDAIKSAEELLKKSKKK